MKTKFLLPVLAVIFAIGMSFAPANFNEDPDNDYIVVNGETLEISEQDCGQGQLQCQVKLEPNGPVYDVFDDETLKNRKMGNGVVIELY